VKTAVLKVLSDIFLAGDDKKVVQLALLQ